MLGPEALYWAPKFVQSLWGAKEIHITENGCTTEDEPIVQLDPIHVVGHAPAAMYFQRGDILTSLEQAAERREYGIVLPTGDKYPHEGRQVAGSYAFDPAMQMTEVTVAFPNSNLWLRPGLNVTLQSSIRTK